MNVQIIPFKWFIKLKNTIIKYFMFQNNKMETNLIPTTIPF